jgi:hypothetical protein
MVNLSRHVTQILRCAPACASPLRTGAALIDTNVTRGSHRKIASVTSRPIAGIAAFIGASM